MGKGTHCYYSCSSICCGIWELIINVCAIMYSQSDDSLECSQNLFIDISLFLQFNGFVVISFSLLHCILNCYGHYQSAKTYPDDIMDTTSKIVNGGKWKGASEIQIWFNVFCVLWQLTWCTIGFILYFGLNIQCKQTSQGKMLLSWCIIYIITTSCCHLFILLQYINSAKEISHEYEYEPIISKKEDESLIYDEIDIEVDDFNSFEASKLGEFILNKMNKKTLDRLWKRIDTNNNERIDSDQVLNILHLIATLYIAYKYRSNGKSDQPQIDKEMVKKQCIPISNWILNQKMNQQTVLTKNDFKEMFGNWIIEYSSLQSNDAAM